MTMPGGRLPGAGRRAVAADDLPAGAADLAGAVGIDGQRPAHLVQHHMMVLHEMGWALTVYPDGTSQVRSPGGKIIRSHSPPPRPG